MHTHGPVTLDAFHRKVLLVRQGDAAYSATGQQLIQMVRSRETAVEAAPHDIRARDALVCDLIRLSATVYEDARQQMGPGGDAAFAQQGMTMVGELTDQAFDHLSVMPTLAFGAQSSKRTSALLAAVVHNMAVAMMERGKTEAGRDTAREVLAQLRAAPENATGSEELASTVEPLLVTLAG